MNDETKTPHAQHAITVATFPVMMNQREAAKALGLSTKFLEADRWSGPKIPYVKIGRAVRYRASDLADFIAANSVGAIDA